MLNKLTTSVMEVLLDLFCNQFSLTPREKEVIAVLATKAVSNKNIAEHLGLSSSTVNNHLNSIFEKTRSGGKAEVLAALLRFALNDMRAFCIFGPHPRILVVDDEAEICDLLGMRLRDEGLDVDCCYNANQALEAIKSGKYDFVISDIRMPDIDGVELLKRIKESYRYRPQVVLMTGGVSLERADALDYGAIDVFEKPFDIERLCLMMISHYLGNIDCRARFLGFNGKPDLRVEKVIALSSKFIGVGGVFLPLAGLDRGTLSRLRAGAMIAFSFAVPGIHQSVEATGEVMWVRLIGDESVTAGIGVRFLRLDQEGQRIVEKVTGEGGMVSYVPKGRQ